MSARIIFEDAEIVVVDKPAMQPVHASPGHEEGSLADELAATRPQMRRVGSAERPGVVHRLDIDTSGVMVFAKTQSAYLNLRRQFESHRGVRKTYLAVCHGAPKPAKGTVDAPVGRGRLPAVSHYELMGRNGSVSLVRFDIETGRTHQIRIHAASIGCPLVGDTLYGDAVRDRNLRIRPRRTLLHAVELAIAHPKTGRPVTFSAPPPADLVYAG